MTIYLKSTDIEGGVTTKGFEKTFELESISFGVTRNVGSRVGKTVTDSSLGVISEISISKVYDVASTKLFANAFSGAILKTMVISLCRQDKAGPQVYSEITLGNVIIAGYNISGMGGEGSPAPQESINLNYSTISIKNTPIKEDGSQGTPATTGWSLITNAAM